MKRNLLYFLILIIVSVVAWFVIKSESSSTIEEEIRTFAIPDTARIGAIFIAERSGASAKLQRLDQGSWILNEKYSVRSDKIDMLLKTFNRVRVKRPVARTMLPKVMRDLSTKGVKVEVYDLEMNHIQTYYIGGADKNTSGTYMMIEGSSKPFVTHIRGWTGYLSTRFFTNVNEWRDRSLSRLAPDAIQELTLEYREQPLAGFRIVRIQSNYILRPLVEQEHGDFSQEKIYKFLGQFNPLIAEGFDNGTAIKDSVVQTCKPIVYLRLTDTLNQVTNVVFYSKNEFEKDGTKSDVIDNDRNFFYVQESGDFGVVQEYATTGKLFKNLKWFLVD